MNDKFWDCMRMTQSDEVTYCKSKLTFKGNDIKCPHCDSSNHWPHKDERGTFYQCADCLYEDRRKHDGERFYFSEVDGSEEKPFLSMSKEPVDAVLVRKDKEKRDAPDSERQEGNGRNEEAVRR